jgi:hypothetical protein
MSICLEETALVRGPIDVLDGEQSDIDNAKIGGQRFKRQFRGFA